MAVESLPNIRVGPIGDEAIIVDAIASEFIEMWSPVVLDAPATGESLPRVKPDNTANNKLVYGVTVGPLVESYGATYKHGRCATAAGQVVQVCTFGRCKLRVNGNSDNIERGDALVTATADGIAVLAALDTMGDNAECLAAVDILTAMFAQALEAANADGSVIPAFVYKAMGTRT